MDKTTIKETLFKISSVLIWFLFNKKQRWEEDNRKRAGSSCLCFIFILSFCLYANVWSIACLDMILPQISHCEKYRFKLPYIYSYNNSSTGMWWRHWIMQRVLNCSIVHSPRFQIIHPQSQCWAKWHQTGSRPAVHKMGEVMQQWFLSHMPHTISLI